MLFWLKLLVLVLSMAAAQALACACGCGAVNPVVLDPGQKAKVSLALRHNRDYTTVTDKGRAGPDGGPATRTVMDLAAAAAVTDNLSIGLSLPLQENRHGDRSDRSPGDPAVGMRWGVYRGHFAKPWLPRTDLHLTWKQAMARSWHDGARRRNDLDLHSNGYDEVLPGVDLWWGMFAWQGGLSLTGILPRERQAPDDGPYERIRPGQGGRLTLSGGYTLAGTGTLLLLADREERGRLHLDGEPAPGPGVLAHGLALVAGLRTGTQQTVGLQIRRDAAILANRNTTRSNSVTLSFMQAI